jgi:hypothetical protein
MNAELIQPKSKLIEIGKQDRGTWVLAGIDLLIVLVLWAAVAYNPGAPKPVAVDPSSQAQGVTAANAQSVAGHRMVAPLLSSSYIGASHGAACNALPAGCGGKVQVRTSDAAVACQPVSRAAQHRNGDLGNPNPCVGMH